MVSLAEDPARVSAPFADRYVNRAEARRIYGALADEYGRAQLRGDPLADDVAAWLAGGGTSAREMLRGALRDGIASVVDAPQVLRRLFAQLDEIPPWADFERMDLGARTYQRLGPAAMMILSAWSLMNGYRSAPAVKPLMYTGQLEKMAPRRLAETSRFVTEVAQVGGMRRAGTGFDIAVRVRLMHAAVRRRLGASPRWDARAWGTPINQADMLATIIEFSLLVLSGARKLGFRFERCESEAVVHLWRYVGHVSGVDEPLLAHLQTEAAGMHLANLVDLVQPGPDDDSVALAQALRAVPLRSAPPGHQRLAHLVTKIHDGLTHAFNGPRIAEGLRVPNRRWRHVVHPARALITPLEVVRRRVGVANRLAVRIGNHIVRSDVARMLGSREPDFRARLPVAPE